MNKIKITDIFKDSFILFLKNFKKVILPFFLFYFIFLFILIILINVFNFDKTQYALFLDSSNAVNSILLYYTPVLFMLFIALPLIFSFTSKIILRCFENKEYKLSHLLMKFFKKLHFILPVLVVFSVLEIPGYLLLIFPGLIIYSFSLFLSIEIFNNDNGLANIFKTSFILFKARFWKTLLFVLVMFFSGLIFFQVIDFVSYKLFPVYTYTFFDNFELFKKNVIYSFIFRLFCYGIIFSYFVFAKVLFYYKIKNNLQKLHN